jgi:alanine dehydrogenase
VADATARDPELAKGVNTAGGAVTNPAVAEALGRASTPLTDALTR